MNVSIIKPEELPLFIKGRNAAYRARSDGHIPYSELDMEKLKNDLNDKSIWYGLYQDGELIGGLMVKLHEDDTATLKRVWVNPHLQNTGGGTYLMQNVELQLKDRGCKKINLSVANSYKPAVHLYKKLGFRTIGITAHVPHTFYFLDMVKTLEPYKYSEIKRIVNYRISRLKFILFFDKYSTPNFLHKLVYGKR